MFSSKYKAVLSLAGVMLMLTACSPDRPAGTPVAAAAPVATKAPPSADKDDRDGGPSRETVLSWLKPEQNIDLDGKATRIVLLGGEVAWIENVSLPDQGRNFSHDVVLSRPALKQARLLEMGNGSVGAAHKGRADGLSFVELSSFGSGQGIVEGSTSLVVFDGWKSIELHAAEESDDTGNCGQKETERDCESISVEWSLADLNQDGVLDVTETTVTKRGPEEGAMATTKTVRNVITDLAKLRTREVSGR